MISGSQRLWYPRIFYKSLSHSKLSQEVEREISFRTEQGLYYSYFKQLVNADSLSEGFSQLQADNKTESGHSINILQRFVPHLDLANYSTPARLGLITLIYLQV